MLTPKGKSPLPEIQRRNGTGRGWGGGGGEAFNHLVSNRLPVFQGPSFTFISPLLAVATDPTWTCGHEGGTNGIGKWVWFNLLAFVTLT